MAQLLRDDGDGSGNSTSPGVTSFDNGTIADPGDTLIMTYFTLRLTADVDEGDWTIVRQDDDSGGGFSTGILVKIAAGGETGGSFTLTTAGIWQCQCYLVDGSVTDISSIVDKAPAVTSTGDPTGTGTSVTTDSTTTLSQADEFAVSVCGIGGVHSGASVDSGFTRRHGSTFTRSIHAYKITTATTALAPTFSWTGAFERSAIIATFKADTTGGGGDPPPVGAPSARPIPIRGLAQQITFPLFNATDDLVTGATSPDPEVSKDGAAFNNTTNAIIEIGSTGIYRITLTATEMDAGTVVLLVKSSNAKPYVEVLYPSNFYDVIAEAVHLRPIIEPVSGNIWPGNIEKILAYLGAMFHNTRVQALDGTEQVLIEGGDGVIWAREKTDTGSVFTLLQPVGGDIIVPPPLGTGLKGYMGCSNTTKALIGYRDKGGTQFWTPQGMAGGYVQEWAKSDSEFWQEFDAAVDFFGEAPSLVYWMLCSHKFVTDPHGAGTLGPFTAEDIRDYAIQGLANLRLRYDGPVHFSGINSYDPGYGTGGSEGGVIWQECQDASDMMIALGHGAAGPDMASVFLGEGTVSGGLGGIHPNSAGIKVLGQAIVDKYGL